tara:strand:- start:47 stop:577 length:531 start_codon:yes stop_codon:yes gene_type:complete
MKNNIKFFFILFSTVIIFVILLKGLELTNDYSNKNISSKINFDFSAKKLLKNEDVYVKDLIEKQNLFIVNIWASWCIPCKDEHKYLMDLKKMNINIVGINYKDNRKNAKEFLNLLGNPYSEIIVDDDGTKSIEFGAIGVPETILVDRKSKTIIKKYVGPINEKSIKEIKLLADEKI